MDIRSPNHRPLIIAISIAAVILIYYVFSGRGSLDLKSRELTNSGKVSQVDAADPKKITVKCKNGESYEILFKEGQQDYNELVFNACGEET